MPTATTAALQDASQAQARLPGGASSWKRGRGGGGTPRHCPRSEGNEGQEMAGAKPSQTFLYRDMMKNQRK